MNREYKKQLNQLSEGVLRKEENLTYSEVVKKAQVAAKRRGKYGNSKVTLYFTIS